MSRNIGIIIAVIIFINFIIGTATKSKKGNPSNKTGRKANPAPTFFGRNNKSSDSAPSTRKMSGTAKEYMKDNSFSGTYSQDRRSHIPNPEIEDPQDSKTFYVIVLGIIVLAAAAFLVYYLYIY